MAMTYVESAALMNDTQFMGRVKVACLNYAQYILLEPVDTAAHNTRVRWANATFVNPGNAAMVCTPPTVMNPNVQADGAKVTDDALQAAVQYVVDEML